MSDSVWQRVTFHSETRARKHKAPLIREVCIKRMALHACAFGNHAERRRCRTDARVQIDSRLDDALARLRLLLRAALEGVGSGHVDFLARARAFIIDGNNYFRYTIVYHES